MTFRNAAFAVCLAIVTLSLAKLAFFPAAPGDRGIVPAAYADGGVIEWKDAMRIVTSGNDGATTYVWDYEGKTRVRKYTVTRGKLTLETFNLDEQK